MITTDHIVMQQDWTTHDRDCPRGSGYCADQAVDLAAKNLREFRLKHWAYFYSREGVDRKTNIVLPRIRNEALERESWRLFEITRNANKLALDIEHD